jgi:hypothetical protein
MPIKITCPNCDSAVRVADKYAGLKVKCPACQGAIAVPAQVAQQPESKEAPPPLPAAESATDADEEFGLPNDVPLDDEPPPLPVPRRPSNAPAKKLSSSKTAGPPPGPRSLGRGAKIAMIAGAIAALCAVIAVAVLLVINGSFGNFSSGPWGAPVRVKDDTLGTMFLVELKDGWYLREANAPAPTRAFLVFYSYKNIGPREGALSISQRIKTESEKNAVKELTTGQPTAVGPENRIEVKTDKGHIYSGSDFADFWRSRGPKRDLGEWRPVTDGKIEGSGQSAFLFVIPTDENPTELLTPKWLGLSRKLPQAPFQARYYSSVFGFLPEAPEKAVPGLIAAMKDNDASVRLAAMHELQRLHPWTVEHVPVLTEALRDIHNDFGMRSEAAKILGELGPAAKDAIPALQEALRQGAPMFGPKDGSWQSFRNATETAYEKIGGRDALVAALGDSIANRYNVVEAAQELGGLVPAANQAVPTLKNFLRIARYNTSYPQIWASAVKEALEKIIGADQAAIVLSELDAEHASDRQQRQAASRRQAEDRMAATMRRITGDQAAAQERRETERRERAERTKGPLSGIWREKKGGNGFRIEDDDTALEIKLYGFNAAFRRFEGKLARRDGKPDSFEGTVEATFVHNPRGYSHRVTATLNKSGQLELTCPEWPDPSARAKPRTQKAVLIRQGDLPSSAFRFPASAPSRPIRTRSLRNP